jgi:hypothetical protein
LLGSSEPGPKGGCTDEIDRSYDVVGEHAECSFTADFLKASGEESPAGRHSLDSSKRMLRSASALSDQGRIGLETSVHSFERILMQMTADKATLSGRAARLE